MRRTDLDGQQRYAFIYELMSVLVFGLSHKTAPIEVRERFAFPNEQACAVAQELTSQSALNEAMVLSTCNRVEFFVRGDECDPRDELLTYLQRSLQTTMTQAEESFYSYADRGAVRHLFRVASSLDSMVVGEPQILGQVKDAYQRAKEAGTISGPLAQLVSSAFRVARRVRNETGIGEMAVSISYVAVELAKKIFGDLDGLSVLLIGAGEMAEAAALHLQTGGAKKFFVTNRTFEKAASLADRFGGTAVEFDRLLELLQRVDIVISSTGAEGYILSKETARGVIAARKNKPIFLVDIAVPRDIDPEINAVDNMFVYDIDDLQQVAEANIKQRRGEAELAEAIVDEEVEKMLRRFLTHKVSPTIVTLNQKLEDIRQGELDRFRSKFGGLTAEQEEGLEALTRGMMNKVAHRPIAEIKRSAADPEESDSIDHIRRAFGLDD